MTIAIAFTKQVAVVLAICSNLKFDFTEIEDEKRDRYFE